MLRGTTVLEPQRHPLSVESDMETLPPSNAVPEVMFSSERLRHSTVRFPNHPPSAVVRSHSQRR
jgi:hypothetical protein